MNKFTVKNVKDFDPVHTFDCGQCFRWDMEEDGSYTGVVGESCVNIRLDGSDMIIENCTEDEYRSLWHDYLDMGRDYGQIKEILSAHDDALKTAAAYGRGIRLLQQDPWETVISFIISQNSNIPRIKKCIELLCEGFGKSLGSYRGRERFAFPSADTLAGLTREDLAFAKLGYRDTYIIETARQVAADQSRGLKAAVDLPFEEAEAYIRSFKGVGPKVANCILLFGLGQYGGFPLDVWMKRIMNRLYGFKENDTKSMAAYAAENFGQYSGFAQQYLFYYARENMLT